MPRPTLSPPPSNLNSLEDYGWKEWFRQLFDRVAPGPFPVTGYEVDTLPPAGDYGSSGFSSIIYVSDAAGGAVLAFSDGTNWLRATDRTIVN